MRKRLLLLFLLTLVLACFQVPAQRRARLERQKRDNLRRIEETNRVLKQTATEKKATIDQLMAINQQVESRQDLINSINQEIGALNEEISDVTAIIESLQGDLAALKKEYAAMVYAASKASVYNRLMFVFASKTFNQFFSRIRYLKQYTTARKEQLAVIKKVRKTLISQQESLTYKKAERMGLLHDQMTENEKLLAARSEQKKIVQQLSDKERQLGRELERRKKADAKLEKLITDLIRREKLKAERAARRAKAKTRVRDPRSNADDEFENIKPDSKPDEGRITLTPEAAQVSRSFAGNKGRLIWPVEAGFISARFGKQPHGILKHVTVDNLGIYLQTNENEKVRAVFDGEIGFVAGIPGMAGKIVTVMHGEYFTVFCNLKNVTVKTGDKVKARQILGEVYTDSEGVSQMQFQIWKNNNRLNPEGWLYTR